MWSISALRRWQESKTGWAGTATVLGLLILETGLAGAYATILVKCIQARLKSWQAESPALLEPEQKSESPSSSRPSSAERSPDPMKIAAESTATDLTPVPPQTLASCISHGTPALRSQALVQFLRQFLRNPVALNLLVRDLLSKSVDRRLYALETLHWPLQYVAHCPPSSPLGPLRVALLAAVFPPLVRAFRTLPDDLPRSPRAKLVMAQTLQLLAIEVDVVVTLAVDETDVPLPQPVRDAYNELTLALLSYEKKVVWPPEWKFDALMDPGRKGYDSCFHELYRFLVHMKTFR